MCLCRAAIMSLPLLAAGCSHEPEVPPLGPVPVVLIVFDALHAGHVSHLGYGRPTTPELDALAVEGVSFTRAFAPAPYTLASIPSILTGRRPDSHGLTSTRAVLPQEEVTLAEMLAGAGYHTVAAVANLNGGAKLGNDQGFERFEELFRAGAPDEVDVVVARRGEELHQVSAEEFLPFTREVLEGTPADQPLFLYLHVLEPHTPYHPPAEFRGMWLDPAYDGPFASGDTAPFLETLRGEFEPSPADVQAGIDLYDATLHHADGVLGQLMDELRRAGLYERALIAVTSDHGEAFWQHGCWGHNYTLFDEMLHVPLVIKPPAGLVPGGIKLERLASVLDVVPTVAQWLDLSIAGFPLDGRSQVPAILDSSWSDGSRSLRLRSHHRVPWVGLLTETHKTIVERAEKGGAVTGVHYYWLEDDPGELNDLAGRRADEVQPTVDELLEWAQEAALNRVEGGRALTVREEQWLKSQGYLDSE